MTTSDEFRSAADQAEQLQADAPEGWRRTHHLVPVELMSVLVSAARHLADFMDSMAEHSTSVEELRAELLGETEVN